VPINIKEAGKLREQCSWIPEISTEGCIRLQQLMMEKLKSFLMRVH